MPQPEATGGRKMALGRMREAVGREERENIYSISRMAAVNLGSSLTLKNIHA